MFNWAPVYISRSYLQVSFGDARLFHTELQIFHFPVKQGQSSGLRSSCGSPKVFPDTQISAPIITAAGSPTSSPPPAGWAAPPCLDLQPPPVNATGLTWPPSLLHTGTYRESEIRITFPPPFPLITRLYADVTDVIFIIRFWFEWNPGASCSWRLTWSRPFLSRTSSCCTAPAWLVAFATSHLSRSLSASSCSMCCCFSFRASCSAVVPEILRA